MSITTEDLKGIRLVIQDESAELKASVQTVIEEALEPLKKDISEIKDNLGNLTTSVDSFAQTVRRHETEWLVLRTQHEKIRDILVAKGIATEDELAVA